MSEEIIPEVNNAPDVVEEPKGAFKELVESVSDLAGKAGEIVEDAVKTVAEEIKETVLGPEEKAEGRPRRVWALKLMSLHPARM